MRIVVDASVARSASVDGGPPAPSCAAALTAFLGQPTLTVAMSRELKHEWTRHGRLFATQWLSAMIARKRFDPVRPVLRVDLLDAAADLPGKKATEVGKDVHLVSLALATDRRVLARDDQQRGLLCRLVAAVPDLATLHWANPVESGTVPWLSAEEGCTRGALASWPPGPLAPWPLGGERAGPSCGQRSRSAGGVEVGSCHHAARLPPRSQGAKSAKGVKRGGVLPRSLGPLAPWR